MSRTTVRALDPTTVQPARFLLAYLIGMALVELVAVRPAAAQTPDTGAERLAIFLDCRRCDETFIRQQMTFVDYVRDRESADVHVLVTVQNTGSRGEAFTLHLIGRRAFEGTDIDVTFTSGVSDTEDEERRGFLRTLQVGLAPYLMRTALADRLSVLVDQSDEDKVHGTDDPWKGWTIEFYGDARADVESSQYAFDARYGVFIDRVTEDWKIRLRPYFNYNLDRFESGEDVIRSESRRDGFDSYLIRSVSQHWSIGVFGDLFSSTFSNIRMRYRVRPGIEYSVFPYRIAARRQLTFAYLVGGSRVAYNDTTLFGKISEVLPEHGLDAFYEITQPWGQIDIGVRGAQYLHDLSKYSVNFGGDVDIRLTRGLSIDFGGRITLVHDQLYLPKGDASLEEVLLRRRQLATNFDMGFSAGIRYRIGSIYNNVVNTRF